ncbi:LysR family transcriptional regulator [Erwiniaceae bacterium BAC15a-03b]|uniref:LysR family transcriptional regulator n=1 Tax=Winslowiella arboricola TaxID=2978220 RepID=A0A9J6PUC0_9GAMM|nr:LysR family transcriptional regulator [Winslowiella arboricola]MCU5774773.1 LysR family transcriptional regulator [Winslowiella arboricola]MCU5780075.1 LysR family transcriptional regulator [Winslowiella arboricola]
MNLQDVHLFLMITETSSLTQAARRLDISPMAVSRRLAALEQELGTRLLQRTTRSVSLTQEGAEFLPYARALLEAEEGARALFSPETKGAVGLLRVTAPSGFGRRNILPLVPTLLSANPALRIDVQLSEEVVDIVGRGIDVAIRIAPLRDSSLIARKLSDNPRVVCASPAYLQKYGVPETLSDLSEHNCLRLTNVLQWTFEADGQSSSSTVEGRFSCSNVDGVRELCVQGLGIAQLTWWDVKKELSEGSLIELTFTDVRPQNLSVWALLPTTRYLPLRVSLFVDELKASLQMQ